MSLSDQKLDEILQSLKRIEKKLKIISVVDKDGNVTDFESSVNSYEKYAREDLKLGQDTIDNQKSAILRFLDDCYGVINKTTVKAYLDSNNSEAWKSNQLKALRRYIRDFLNLGNWINDFEFTSTRVKIKSIPTDDQLRQFCDLLSPQAQIVFLVLFNSGLRLNEVLSLRLSNITLETGTINATEIHKGTTKSSWISFITKQTTDILENWFFASDCEYDEEDHKIFCISDRAIQQEFKKASENLGFHMNPHLLRTVFAEKCTQVGIKDKYINAFCGRVSQGVLAKNYTDYSPEALRKQYDLVEPLLTF